MKKIARLVVVVLILSACATPQQNGPNAKHGLDSAMLGLAHLVLSPIQIAAGLMEGIAAIPFYLSTNIHEINKGLIEAQAKITMDDTYEAAYGKRLSQVPDDGNTGEVFRRMKHATEFFQKILKQYGVENYDSYILTSIDTATDKGFTLFAVVYRPAKKIDVLDKYDGKTHRTFTSEDRLFYEPFALSADNQKLDTIVDWAGLESKDVETQKGQAIMLTMAANSVVMAKRSPEYWDVEKRWIAGDYLKIVQAQMNKVSSKMKISQ